MSTGTVSLFIRIPLELKQQLEERAARDGDTLSRAGRFALQRGLRPEASTVEDVARQLEGARAVLEAARRHGLA